MRLHWLKHVPSERRGQPSKAHHSSAHLQPALLAQLESMALQPAWHHLPTKVVVGGFLFVIFGVKSSVSGKLDTCKTIACLVRCQRHCTIRGSSTSNGSWQAEPCAQCPFMGSTGLDGFDALRLPEKPSIVLYKLI